MKKTIQNRPYLINCPRNEGSRKTKTKSEKKTDPSLDGLRAFISTNL